MAAVTTANLTDYHHARARRYGNGAGWDPAWDPERPPHIIRPYKGTKRARTREARVAAIDRAMAGMDDKVAAYRKARDDRKPAPGVEQLFKRIIAMRGPSHKRDSDWIKTEALFAGARYPDRDDRDEGDADDGDGAASKAKKKSGKGPKKKK